MRYSSFLVMLFSGFAMVSAAPIRRAGACFVVGKIALPAEVSTVVTSIENHVTCLSTTVANTGGVPDVQSGPIKYSSIDFQDSSSAPLAFALSTFATPTDPSTADLTTFQDQLNTYLAIEAGARSTGSTSFVNQLKVPKFFLQFQIARIQTAQGANLTGADTVSHQLEKVQKNAVGATAAQLATLNELAAQLS